MYKDDIMQPEEVITYESLFKRLHRNTANFLTQISGKLQIPRKSQADPLSLKEYTAEIEDTLDKTIDIFYLKNNHSGK